MIGSTGMNQCMAGPVKMAAQQAQGVKKAGEQAAADQQDTVDIRMSREPIITDRERRCLNMISRENIVRELRDPSLLALTAGAAGCLGLLAAMSGGPAFGVTAATALSGVILGAFAAKGTSKALKEKRAWQEVFAKNPEALSIEKLREPYLNVYLKATGNGLA